MTRTKPHAPRSRALENALLALAAAGIALSVYLVLVHAGEAGGACTIENTRLDCRTVAESRWSTLLGVPLAAWGVLAYATVAALALGARARPDRPGFGTGLLVVLGGFMAAAAVVLAYVSEVLIGALCLMCMGSWLASAAILGVAVMLARKAGGAGAALRSDLNAAAARPARAAVAGGIALAAAAGLLVAYRASAGTPPRAAPATSSRAPVTILEFSDYLCPFCSQMHDATKRVEAEQPHLRFERRFFPLDDACNPLVKRPFHVGACELSRAGICAMDQGKFGPLDDALYANQAAKRPLEVIAAEVGLDLAALRRCMDAPETADRLRADIEQGLKLGIRGTPTYVHDGKVAKGLPQLLEELGGKPAP